ncbi:hypothetical protein TNCV_338091 [Trichonephila clavipes]|nr:hypothetical protein TNCV_338091 [Trichonephila clavipes]
MTHREIGTRKDTSHGRHKTARKNILRQRCRHHTAGGGNGNILGKYLGHLPDYECYDGNSSQPGSRRSQRPCVNNTFVWPQRKNPCSGRGPYRCVGTDLLYHTSASPRYAVSKSTSAPALKYAGVRHVGTTYELLYWLEHFE